VTESRFINPENWRDIERGYFYQAAMYYLSDTEQPLKFLVSDDDGVLSIEERNGNFAPIVDDNGRKKAVEQTVIITVKPRQVVVLSNNVVISQINSNIFKLPRFLDCQQKNVNTNWYNDLVSDMLEGFAYIPNRNYGVEVDLTQISTIHKSMLLEKQSKVPTDRMEFIESQILEVLDL